MGVYIQGQVRDLQHRRHRLLGASRAAQQSLHAGSHLVQVEGLRHVVVRASAQPLHAISDRVTRSEEEDRQLRITSAQTRQRLQSVHARHLYVQDHDVRVEARRLRQRIQPVLSRGRLPTLVPQGLREQVRQHRLVVNNEHTGHPAIRLGHHHGLLVFSQRGTYDCVTRASPGAEHTAWEATNRAGRGHRCAALRRPGDCSPCARREREAAPASATTDQRRRRPSSARPSVTESAYSRSPPMGRPIARREVSTPIVESMRAR